MVLINELPLEAKPIILFGLTFSLSGKEAKQFVHGEQMH